MKFQIMIKILFILLKRKRVSAGQLAAEFGCSVRTVYRYIEEMCCAGIPIDVARGAGGGISVSDAYKLPTGLFTREEYTRVLDAVLAMQAETGDPVLREAAEKISARSKTQQYEATLTGNILVDSGTWADESKFSEKLALLERCIEEKRTAEILYVDREGEETRRTVAPHLLIYKQNLWYVYAYCDLRKDFRLFKVGRIRCLNATEEHFTPRPFSRDDLPLSFWRDGENDIEARFEVSPEALPFAQEWLGVDNIVEQNGKFYGEVILPDDESLIMKILSVGAGFKVLSPASLAERVADAARAIESQYETP